MAPRTIGTEIKLEGEKTFNDQMKAINAGLKTTRSDMAALTSEFADNADSAEALRAKQKLLQSSVEQNQDKVQLLRKAYEDAAKTYGENSAQAQKYKQQLNYATIELNKQKKALADNTAALNKLGSEEKKYTPVTQKMADGVKKASDKLKDLAETAKTKARNWPVLAEAIDIATGKIKILEKATNAAGKSLKLMGTGVAGVGKVVGGASAAAAAGVAAIGAGGVAVLGAMAGMAKEAADAAKAAQEAGEELTETQQRWLAFSNQLDALSGSATAAKGAIAEILLPMLGDLSTEGGAFLDSFVQDMEGAAGNTQKQTEILGQYIANGAKLIIDKLPEYMKAGREILSGIFQGFDENSDQLLDMGLDLVMDLLKFIMDSAPALAEAGIEMVMQLIEGIDGQDLADTSAQLVDKVITGLAKAAPALIPAAAKLVLEVVVGLARNAPMLLSSGGDLIVALVDGILAALGDVGAAADEIMDVFISMLRNSDSKLLQFGADAIEWIKNGILAAWDGLVSLFNNLWDNLFTGRDVDVNVNPSASGEIDGSHAAGLRYVPFDGYLAQLHRGEAVLPADEAAAYRAGQGAQTNVFNLTINTKSIAKEDMDMLVSYMNGKLGAAL